MDAVGKLVMDCPYILNAVIVSMVVFMAVLLPSRWFLGQPMMVTLREAGFRKVEFQRLLPGVVLSLVLLCGYPLLGYLFSTEIRLTDNWYLNLMGLFLTGGLTEEMLFRGFLFGGVRKEGNFRKAILVSTLMFTLAHLFLFTYMSWPLALMSTILAIGISVPFAYLFEYGSKTIWAPAMVHTTVRTIGLIFTTDPIAYPGVAAGWIGVSLILPYGVLAFHEPFRKMLKSPDSNWSNR